MFDGSVAADYNQNQRRWERTDPRCNGHKRTILAVRYTRYDGGEVQAICPACHCPTRVSIYPFRLGEVLRRIEKRDWVCTICDKENGAVLRAFDRADGYGPPTPEDFEDNLPF